MASNLFKKYIWLVDTIYREGPISFAEINHRWQRSVLSEGGRIALRTFHNHREAIEELFDISISCDERTNRYYIANSDDLQRNNIASWLLNSFSISNVLCEAQSLHERVLVEEVPSSQGYLSDLLEAMRDNLQVEVTYQPFYDNEPFDLTLRPLFVKLFERRWYLYADKPNNSRIKLYALDRMQGVRLTDVCFAPPADLDPAGYLAGAFGVAVYDDIKPRFIRIRAYRGTVNYLRTLPLHASQREVTATDNYVEFEYWVAPTIEFYQAVLAQHSEVEVISPMEVRDEVARVTRAMNRCYAKDKHRLIFLDFDGVLNTERNIVAMKKAGKPLSDQYGYLFDPESVVNLERIIEQTDASVVISSSWRLEGAERMTAMWKERQLPGRMIGVTCQCMGEEDYLEVTPNMIEDEMLVGKGNEIQQWLWEHAPAGCSYVILDDEPDILNAQRQNFIQINPKCGITAEDVQRVVSILTK